MSYLKQVVLFPVGVILAGVVIGLVVFPVFGPLELQGLTAQAEISDFASVLSLLAIAYACIFFMGRAKTIRS